MRVPAAQWEAAEKGARQRRDEASRLAEARPAEEQAEEEKKREPERAPGQVVEVAPGNGEEDPNARFASETSNRVERERIARNRAAGQPVTMPKPTVDAQPEAPTPPGPRSEGELAALGQPTPDRREGSEGGSRIEIPSVERRDAISLPEDRTGRGALRNQRRSGATEIRGELNIRRHLANLNSSLFVVEREGPAGAPAGWRFRGAGWGHGVGMCQMGAIGRAERGDDHRAILRHYYGGVSPHPLY